MGSFLYSSSFPDSDPSRKFDSPVAGASNIFLARQLLMNRLLMATVDFLSRSDEQFRLYSERGRKLPD